MGTIPTVATISAGAVVTSTYLNSLKAAVDFWALTPRCYAYQTSTSSPATSTGTVLPMQAEVFDIVQSGDSPMHDNSTNNSRVYVRTSGKYIISGQVTFANNSTGIRQAYVRLNAAGSPGGGSQLTLANAPALTAVPTSVPIPTVTVPLTAGDYIELFGWQNSGGSLATVAGQGSTFLSLVLDAA